MTDGCCDLLNDQGGTPTATAIDATCDDPVCRSSPEEKRMENHEGHDDALDRQQLLRRDDTDETAVDRPHRVKALPDVGKHLHVRRGIGRG